MDVQPTVQRKTKTRQGKGFSRAELKEAGLDPKRALKLGIPVDLRRRTSHKENIGLVKKRSAKVEKAKQTKSKKKQTQQ